jgi:hypothetical protein
MAVVNRTNFDFCEPGSETGPHDDQTIVVSAGTGRMVVVVFTTASAGAMTLPLFDPGGANEAAMTVITGLEDVVTGGTSRMMWAYYDVPDALAPGAYSVGCTSAVSQRVGACAWQRTGATGAPEAVDSDVTAFGDAECVLAGTVTAGADIFSVHVSEASGDTAAVACPETTITAQAKGTAWTVDAAYMADGVADATETVNVTWTESGNARTIAAMASFAAGAAGVEGDAALTLPAMTVASAGTVAVQGASALTLPAFTVTAAGTLANVIVVLPTTPAFAFDAGAVLGVVIEGRTADAALSLPAWTASGAGTIPVQGASALTLPQFTVSASGGALANVAEGAITLPAFTIAGAGTIPVVGAGAITLPAWTVSGAGAVSIQGAGAITLPAWTLIAAGGATFVPLARIYGTVRIIREIHHSVKV